MNKNYNEKFPLAIISREFLKEYRINRYRLKKVDDMSDEEVVQKCHWFVEENKLSNEWFIFRDKREKEMNND